MFKLNEYVIEEAALALLAKILAILEGTMSRETCLKFKYFIKQCNEKFLAPQLVTNNATTFLMNINKAQVSVVA